MKLRALRLHGFKSFADRTEVVFHDGMTAVVGPNGCGKSNISDAIRWVLGEQRPTAIRGAKMEEAIFQGTIDRRPVNRGSVSIEVTNDDGALPVPFTEVEITRTVYRDGGSDYFLNRSPCRLRDIQDLCRDTGLGANAYSIIENRMIDAILSERAEERRGLFEEAAGIGKYKDRRKEATRRLERAQVDLQRLEDLIAEVQSKVRSLARQKGAAERYAGFRKRRLDLEMSIARRQLGELGARLREVRASLAGEVPRDESLRAKVSEAESRLETLRLEHLALEKARNSAAARLEETRSRIGRWERDLAVAEERSAHAERRLAQIGEERGRAATEIAESTEWMRQVELGREDLMERRAALATSAGARAERAEAARTSLARARAALSEIEAREREVARGIAQLRGDADAAEARSVELDERIAHLATELQEARDAAGEAALQGDLFTDRMEALTHAVAERRRELEGESEATHAARAALETARATERGEKERLGALSARWSALSEMERAREGVDPVLKALLASPPKGVHGILADFLSGAPEDAATLESVLGVFLRAVVVQTSGVARDLARWFREEWSGGGGLVVLPLDRVPDVEAGGDLVGRVRAQGAGAPWVRALLAGFEVKDEPGRASPKQGRHEVRRVVQGGGWVESGGAIHLGNPMGSTGILERRRELAALGKAVQKAEVAASSSSAAAAEAAARVDALERSLAELRGRLQEAEDAHREARSEHAERSTSRARMERLVEEITGRLETARSSLELARARAEGSRSEGEGLRAEGRP
jgi:chromosome segregation protein